MPHIKAETTKAIRKEIKKSFPNMKFSVTTENHSTVRVALLESKIEMHKDHFTVNEYYLQEEENKEIIPVFEKVLEIINSHKKQRTITVDGDYGNVPNFYINLSVGKWNKPYKQVG